MPESSLLNTALGGAIAIGAIGAADRMINKRSKKQDKVRKRRIKQKARTKGKKASSAKGQRANFTDDWF